MTLIDRHVERICGCRLHDLQAVAADASHLAFYANKLYNVALLADLLTLLWPQYVCVGYALYDEEKLRQQREEAKKSPTAPIELPYCEGERPLASRLRLLKAVIQ